MNDLRERLRAADPGRDTRPLDATEIADMRRAMRAAAPPRVAAWKPVAGFAVAAGALAIALLVWPSANEPTAPVPPAVVVPPLAEAPPRPLPVPPVLEAPPLAVAADPRPAPEPPSDPSESPVREVRFVTASGTQIVWTFRPPEEGA